LGTLITGLAFNIYKSAKCREYKMFKYNNRHSELCTRERTTSSSLGISLDIKTNYRYTI